MFADADKEAAILSTSRNEVVNDEMILSVFPKNCSGKAFAVCVEIALNFDAIFSTAFTASSNVLTTDNEADRNCCGVELNNKELDAANVAAIFWFFPANAAIEDVADSLAAACCCG